MGRTLDSNADGQIVAVDRHSVSRKTSRASVCVFAMAAAMKTDAQGSQDRVLWAKDGVDDWLLAKVDNKAGGMAGATKTGN